MRKHAGIVASSAVALFALLLCGCAAEPGSLPDRAVGGEFEEHRLVTEADRMGMLQVCFDDAGLGMTALPGGGVSWPDGQPADSTAYEEVWLACAVRFGETRWMPGEMSAEEREFLYDYSAAVLAPCVRSAGYEVPPLPYRDEYVAQRASWWAYEYAEVSYHWDRFEQLSLENLRMRCPELPAGWNER